MRFNIAAQLAPANTFVVCLVNGLLLAMLLVSAGAVAQEGRTGSVSSPLTYKNAELWDKNGNVVPVCWATGGYDREKKIVRDALRGSWEFYSNIRFTGWDACPTSGAARFVRVGINAQDGSNGGGGGVTHGYGTALLSSASDSAGRLLPPRPGVELSFNPDGTAELGRVEYIAVHEFGHVLGFVHEQDTPGNVEGPAYCKSPGNEPDATSLTAYDRDSVMNYCNRDGNSKGNLTDADIVGVQALYGVRVPNVASRNSCASASLKQTASVAWAWNDGSNQTSIAVFPSDRSKFLTRATWSTREGGWGDDVKWFAGDFNGDGRTDMGAAWNDGGQVTLTVRRSTGSSFAATHWAIKTGGWIGTAVWLPGDFNGDGRTDVAGIWNDGGKVSIAVFLSDGTRFVSQTPQWSVRDGGWGDSVKWFAADFDGDGRTDIGAAWYKAGKTVLTVRQSTGSRFAPAHWSTDAGNWTDSAVFVAGDFNNDGRADVARLWNDLGGTSIAVSLSDGASFRPAVDWSTRDGGWIQGSSVKWFAGDFNGDGRTDIGAAWDNEHLNTIAIRQSTGSAFTAANWAVKAGGWRDSATWCSGLFQSIDVASEVRALGPSAGFDATAALATRGGAITAMDPLSVELRRRQAGGAAQRGFDVGMAAAEGQTLAGPGKQRIHDSLSPAEQPGFEAAVEFSLERNRNADVAATGAAIAAKDPRVAAARASESDVFYWLGFDIASGIFGDPALGARGNTATGPGSLGIRNALGAAGQRGFDASVRFHLSQSYRH
ncbi:MAG: FG-GAP-like repeat-containing protein [Gammaproteobacteria bacterium]